MKVKKTLKEAREKIDEQILSENKDIYDSLVSEYFADESKPQKATVKPRRRAWAWAVSCVLVVCLVVGLSVSLTLPREKEYLSQNQVTVTATLDEFKSATNTKIDFSENYSISNLGRVYDSVSSDTLEYSFNFDHKEEYISGKLHVIVNNRYNFSQGHLGEILKAKFGEYDMDYSVKEGAFESVPINQYFGCINYTDYKLYFEFQE